MADVKKIVITYVDDTTQEIVPDVQPTQSIEIAAGQSVEVKAV